MRRSEPTVSEVNRESGPGKAEALVSMFEAAPLLFAMLFLFLLVLAIPVKAFNPRTRIFR